MGKSRKKKPVRKSRPKNGFIHSESTIIAKEATDCDACAWLQTQDQAQLIAKMTAEERKYITKISRNKFKIITGMHYTSQVVEYNGKMVRSNFLPKVHAICHKYKVYPKL